MKVTDPRRPVTSAWLAKEAHRLDAPPFLSGAVEARVVLDKLKVPKQSLRDVTHGYNGGIFNGPQFKRYYVDESEYGIPFLGSSSMLQADLGNLPYISKKFAKNAKMIPMHVSEGMTLISCSGTIGRTVYARREMFGMLTSQHIMKIIPNTDKIHSGYLYAYLSCYYGKTLVTNGTYGAIIQHIEPEHIAHLEVPRFGSTLEKRIHDLVEQAGKLRNASAEVIKKISQSLIMECSLDKFDGKLFEMNASVSSSEICKRLDATFHSAHHKAVIKFVGSAPSKAIAEICSEIFEPPRLKRQPIEESSASLPFFGTSAILNSDPEPSYFVSRKLCHPKFITDKQTILIPRSGQVSGIIGNPVIPIGRVLGSAVSEDAIRLVANNSTHAGYLYIYLRTKFGQVQLKSIAFGSSVPHLNVNGIGDIIIPWPNDSFVEEIGTSAMQAVQMQTEAIELENEARRLVEEAIEANYSPLTH